MRNTMLGLAGTGLLAVLTLAGPGVSVQAFDQNASTARPVVDATPFEALVLGTQKYKSGDMEAAVRALEMAADGGEPLALWKLGRMYAEGDGVAADHRKAFEIFQKLANDHADGNPRGRYSRAVASAFVTLANYYLEGIPDSVSPNPHHAIRLFRHAAMYFADSEAQYRLARLYLDGDKVGANPRTAARWLKLAADKNHVEAQALLGQMMWVGEVIPRRPISGLSWLLIAREGANAYDREWIDALVADAMAGASDLTVQIAQQRLDEWRRDNGFVVESETANANG